MTPDRRLRNLGGRVWPDTFADRGMPLNGIRPPQLHQLCSSLGRKQQQYRFYHHLSRLVLFGSALMSVADVYQGAVVITSTVDPRPMCSTQLTGGSAVPTNPSLAAGYAMILFSYDRSFALLYGSFHGKVIVVISFTMPIVSTPPFVSLCRADVRRVSVSTRPSYSDVYWGGVVDFCNRSYAIFLFLFVFWCEAVVSCRHWGCLVTFLIGLGIGQLSPVQSGVRLLGRGWLGCRSAQRPTRWYVHFPWVLMMWSLVVCTDCASL